MYLLSNTSFSTDIAGLNPLSAGLRTLTGTHKDGTVVCRIGEPTVLATADACTTVTGNIYIIFCMNTKFINTRQGNHLHFLDLDQDLNQDHHLPSRYRQEHPS